MFDYDDHDDLQEDHIFLEDEEVDFYEYGDQEYTEITINSIVAYVVTILLFIIFLIVALT